MRKTLRIDITDKIVAKFKEEYLELYSHKFRIGKFYMHAKEKRYELEDGYIYEGGRFYRLITMRRDSGPSLGGTRDDSCESV